MKVAGFRFSPSRPARVLLMLAVAAGVGAAWAPPARAQAGVRVYQDTLTLRAYDCSAALVPTQPGDPVFPYPRMNLERVGPLRDVTTYVVVLESAGTRLTIAPEYGGRLLRWYDKLRAREVLYVNPVLKPTPWGYRGWWYATGGIEWAFPTNEHGLNEWRPWEYWTFSGAGYAGVTVADRESRTGLIVAVTITLYADERIAVRPRVVNRTGAAQPFQFWLNAMLPHEPELQLDFPADQVQVHATGDPTLPAPGAMMTWPMYNGRDFSRAAEWRQYLGIFAAPVTRGSMAVLDPVRGTSVTRDFPSEIARGAKLFLLGDIDPETYTDGASRYLEFWGGYTQDFATYAWLAPGGTVTWVEWWRAP